MNAPPRLDCSTTIGTSCIASRIGDLLTCKLCWVRHVVSGGEHQEWNVAVRGGERHPVKTIIRQFMDDLKAGPTCRVRGNRECHDAFEEKADDRRATCS